MSRPPQRLRRLRGLRAALLPLVLATTLAACGEEDGSGSGSASGQGAEGLAAVEIAGEPGSAFDVTFTDQMTVEETETEVIVEGDGEVIEEGESALAHFYIGNGFEQEQAVSTYDSGQPQLVTLGDQLIPGIREALEGQAVGSRVVVAATPADAFGESGNPQLGIGNADPVLFVVDILSQVLEGPEGEKVDPANPVPELQFSKGTLSSLSFPPAVKATDRLVTSTLVRGDGPEVTADSTVVVDYLGQVLGKAKPFDESYSKPDPVAFPLSGVVEGWQQGLQGVPVGSRVVLQIPPRLGYGEQGQPSAGIQGDDTLVFVIDVLGAS